MDDMMPSTVPLYNVIGHGYVQHRRSDARIAHVIANALAEAESVLNVGAGTGSYEPTDRRVIALEPSAVMVAQRPSSAAPVVQGRAEQLPFPDGAFDAVLGVLTLHHWSDQWSGLRECVRVARERVVLLTYDPAAEGFWLTRDYLPEFMALDKHQFPPLDALETAFGSGVRVNVTSVPIPRDCVDGFLGAFGARPTAYLDPRVQAAISSFGRVDTRDGLAQLRSDLNDGRWIAKHGTLLELDVLDIGYRLVTAELSSRRAA
jgi:SAM-dependent methyltransferase